MAVDHPAALGMPELRHAYQHTSSRRRRDRRSLESNDDYESLLVDDQGNAYEPYSLAWRYLGLYKDCSDEGDDDEGDDDGSGDSGSGSGDEEDCRRQLLWAAYVDPHYGGSGIEEYQVYDPGAGAWDDAACLASEGRRCARLDCHESRTRFRLVGVFKETDGMYDFTEQLFKHEGYCVWQRGDGGDDDDDGSASGSGDDWSDAYETMETWMEKWPTSCQKLDEKGPDGGALYLGVEPLPEGNMTLEVYTDSRCTTASADVDYEAYLIQHYVTLYQYYSYYYGYDYGYNKGVAAAAKYSAAIVTWNDKMSAFKVCQPCRAYNLFAEDDGSGGSNSNDRRALGGDDTDGDGEARERFNCYDDAGYTNVDQCYKFETHTTVAAADAADLHKASAQGSILRVRDGWRAYGEGGYASPRSGARLAADLGLGAAAVAGLLGCALLLRGHLRRRGRDAPAWSENLVEGAEGGAAGTGVRRAESDGASGGSESTDGTSSAGSAAGENDSENRGTEAGAVSTLLSKTKGHLRRYGFLERRKRRVRDTFYTGHDDGAASGFEPRAAGEEGAAAERSIELGTLPPATSPAETPESDQEIYDHFREQYHLMKEERSLESDSSENAPVEARNTVPIAGDTGTSERATCRS